MMTSGDIEWRLNRMEELLIGTSVWEEWHRKQISDALESFLKQRKDIKLAYSADYVVMLYMADTGDSDLEEEPIRTQTDLLVFIDKAKKKLVSQYSR